MKYKSFVYFCDDLRREVGGKVSYMGVRKRPIRVRPDELPLTMTITVVVSIQIGSEFDFRTDNPMDITITVPGMDDSGNPNDFVVFQGVADLAQARSMPGPGGQQTVDILVQDLSAEFKRTGDLNVILTVDGNREIVGALSVRDGDDAAV